MKKKLYFVSSNAHKIAEVKKIFDNSSFFIKEVSLELQEIQSLNAQRVLKSKVHEAWSKIRKPLIIDDTGFYIKKYSHFPGTMTKLVVETIGVPGLLKLTNPNDLCYFQTFIAYYNGLVYKSFSGKIMGHIKNNSLTGKSKMISDVFFTRDGSLLYDGNKFTHRELAFEKLKEYLSEEKI